MAIITFPPAVAALSVIYDSQAKNVVLTLQSATGTPYQVKFHPGIVAGIAVALISVGRKFAPSAGATGADVQPITVTSARKAILPDGRPILDLELEGSLHFPITFPPEAIPLLQTALAELQSMTTSKSPKAH
jgi:hypothetical protein